MIVSFLVPDILVILNKLFKIRCLLMGGFNIISSILKTFIRIHNPLIFNNHIVRSKWNWQFNRKLSLRLILQYTATLANPALTSLESTKQFNGDFLITYLVHPGTALYVGYNSDLQNLALDPVAGTITRTRNGYINDSRQFFVKVSYLFRF